MRDDSAEILFLFFSSAGGPCEQFWHGQEYPPYDAVHTAVPLPTTVLPTLQGALKGGVGEAAVACDIPEPSMTVVRDTPMTITRMRCWSRRRNECDSASTGNGQGEKGT